MVWRLWAVFLLGALGRFAAGQPTTAPPMTSIAANTNSSCVASMWCGAWNVPIGTIALITFPCFQYICECPCSCGAQCFCTVMQTPGCGATPGLQYWAGALCNGPANATTNITQALDSINAAGSFCQLQFGGTIVPIGSMVTLSFGGFVVSCSCACTNGCVCPCTVLAANSSAPPITNSVIPFANCPSTPPPPCTCPVISGLSYYAPIGSYANLTYNFGNGQCVQVTNAACGCSCPCTMSCVSAPVVYSCTSNVTNSFSSTAAMAQNCPSTVSSSVSVTSPRTTPPITTTTTMTTTTTPPNQCSGCFLTGPSGVLMQRIPPGTLHYWSMIDSAGNACVRLVYGCPCVSPINNCTTCTCNLISNVTVACNGSTTLQTSWDYGGLCYCPAFTTTVPPSTQPSMPPSSSSTTYSSSTMMTSTPVATTPVAPTSTTTIPTTTAIPTTTTTPTTTAIPTTTTIPTTTIMPTMTSTTPSTSTTTTTSTMMTTTTMLSTSTAAPCYYCNAVNNIYIPPGSTLISMLPQTNGLTQFAYVCICSCTCNCSCPCTVLAISCQNNASICVVAGQCPLANTSVIPSSGSSTVGRKKRNAMTQELDTEAREIGSYQFVREISRFIEDQSAIERYISSISEPFKNRHTNHFSCPNSRRVIARISCRLTSGLENIQEHLEAVNRATSATFISTLMENYLAILFGSILGSNFHEVNGFKIEMKGIKDIQVTSTITLRGCNKGEEEWRKAVQEATMDGAAQLSKWNSVAISTVQVLQIDVSGNNEEPRLESETMQFQSIKSGCSQFEFSRYLIVAVLLHLACLSTC